MHEPHASQQQRSPRRGRRPFGASLGAALGAALALACAGGPSPAPPPVAAAPARPPEDALPTFFGPDEVDVIARPIAPIRPEYPPSLRALGVEGTVDARVGVLPDGTAGPAKLLASSHVAFTEALGAALREARFQPARRGGRPVASWWTVRVSFALADGGRPVAPR